MGVGGEIISRTTGLQTPGSGAIGIVCGIVNLMYALDVVLGFWYRVCRRRFTSNSALPPLPPCARAHMLFWFLSATLPHVQPLRKCVFPCVLVSAAMFLNIIGCA